MDALITPLGHRTEYAYDDAGNVIRTVDPAGDTTRFHVDILTNRPDSISRYDQQQQRRITARFTYDLDGNRITHRGSPREGTRRWFPDRLGRDSVMQDELGNQELRLYDLAGNLTLFRNRQGDEVHMEYDAAGRVERQILDAVEVDDAFERDSAYGLPIGTLLVPADTITFQYDEMGRPGLIENRHARVRRTYAPEGAILEEVDSLQWTGQKYVKSYSYAPSGARKTLTTPGARVFTYAYGPGGVLDQIQVSTGGTVAFRWDDLGRRDSVVLPPVGSMADGVWTVYRYDADGRIRQILADHPALSTPMVNLSWPSYDAAGRPKRLDAYDGATLLTASTFWEYDGLGQLDSLVTVGSSVFARRYMYDESGNRTFERAPASTQIDSIRSVVQDSTNRLLWRNEYWDTIHVPERYRYDAAGNLVFDSTYNRPRPEAGVGVREDRRYRYFYDALGRLAGGTYEVAAYTDLDFDGIREPAGSFDDTIHTRYDGLGRLLYRKKPGLGTHRFLYDGDNVLAVDGHEFLHGGGVDDPLILYPESSGGTLMCSGEPAYYATHQGRLLRFYQPTTGQDCTTELPGWDAAGQFAGAIAGSFGFELERQGQDSLGLSFFRNRWYDAKTGRFTQEDPIGFAGGLNLYAYAGNNPATYTDPFGLCPVCIIVGIVEGASAAYDIYQTYKAFRRSGAEGVEALKASILGGIAPGPGHAYLKGARAADTWARANTLADHFRRHGGDFGARSARHYAEMASEFLQDAQARGLPTKIDSRGGIRVYDPNTNTFGAYNPDGTTRTFYKPDPRVHGYPTNLDYWNAQPGRLQ